MAAETEVERLVTRLIGDNASFKRMMSESVHILETAAKQIEHHTDGISAKAITLGELGAGAVETLAEKFKELGPEALAAYEKHEDAQFRLSASIQAGGHVVDSTLEHYEHFAKGISDVTTQGSAATLGLLQTAESLGLTGTAAERAAKEAVAIEGALGHSAEGAIRLTTALAEGHAEMLGRFLPAIRGIKDPTLQAAKAHELLAKMFDVTKASTQTVSGQIAMFHKSVHGLMAEVGGFIAEGLKPWIAASRDLIGWLKGLDPTIKRVAVSVASLTVATVALRAALTLGAAFEVLTKIGGVLVWLANPVTLAIAAVLSLGAAFTYAVGGVGPMLKAIGDGFSSVMDYLRPIGTEIGAIFKSASSAVSEVAGWVKILFSAFSGQIDFFIAGIKTGFGAVRYYALTALIFVEYFFSRWKEVAMAAFAFINYGQAKLASQFVYFFATYMPTAVSNFSRYMQQELGDLFRNVAISMLSTFQPAFIAVTTAWVKFVAKQKGMSDQAADFLASGVSAMLDAEFNTTINGLKAGLNQHKMAISEILGGIPARVAGPIEKALGATWVGLLFKLGVGFEAFRKKRMAELMNGKEAGEQFGGGFAGGAIPEINKVKKALDMRDAVEVGSAEAFTRIQKHLQGLVGEAGEVTAAKATVAKAHRAAGGGGGGPITISAPPWFANLPGGIGAAGGQAAAGLPPGPPPSLPGGIGAGGGRAAAEAKKDWGEETTKLLKQLLAASTQRNNRDDRRVVEIRPIGLGGGSMA